YIKKIDEMGGMIKAIENGFIQGEIQNASYKYQKAIESGEITTVGVNKYRSEEKTKQKKVCRQKSEVEKKQKFSLQKIKKQRDTRKVEKSLKKLENQAKTDENKNLFPVIIEAVENYATVGEVCDVLRNIYGEFKPGRVI
ncbi:MAG: methylmalonyl-CoA mutase family protein, partial [Elusimicrobiota bacterium]|nr:methylmalonyl-CoA mutase family protein [Elusimicrobiota bacterium]